MSGGRAWGPGTAIDLLPRRLDGLRRTGGGRNPGGGRPKSYRTIRYDRKLIFDNNVCLMETSHVSLTISKNEPDSGGSIGIAADVSVRPSRGVHPSWGGAASRNRRITCDRRHLPPRRGPEYHGPAEQLSSHFHYSCSCSGPACEQAQWEPPLQNDMVPPEGPATFTPARAGLA